MTTSSKQIVKNKWVNGTADDLWRLWSSSDGLASFFSSDNKIELRIGGAYEIYFLMENPYGERGSEGCKILSYLPGRMISFSWNAPPQFPEIRNSDYKTWVIVEISEESSHTTKVTLTHLGWPDDPAWQPVYLYFENAWDKVMDSLESSLK